MDPITSCNTCGNMLKIETQLKIIFVRQKYTLNAPTWIILTANILSFLIKLGIATVAGKTCFHLQQ